MDRPRLHPVVLTGALSLQLALLLAIATSSPIAQADDMGSVMITAPKDNARVSEPFTLRWSLDKGMQGDHVHLYIDGENRGVVRAMSREISGLSPGKHMIEVRLASKSHAELGPKASITITGQ